MTLSSWQNKLNKYFMYKTLLMKGGVWFYTENNVEDDDSYMDTYVSPLFGRGIGGCCMSELLEEGPPA